MPVSRKNTARRQLQRSHASSIIIQRSGEAAIVLVMLVHVSVSVCVFAQNLQTTCQKL